MSYILDALRKSDQQRQRGATPTLLTVQTTPTEPTRPRYLLNGVIAAALIAAGVLVGWLQPWQDRQAEPVASGQAASVSTRDMAPPSYGSTESPGRPPQEASMQAATPAAQAGDPATNFALTQQQPDFADGSSASPQSAADRQSAEFGRSPVTSRAAASDDAERVLALNELPPAIRREIPGIAIMFHAYSSAPGERRVMINGNMAKEGETLADGLALQQITPDGVILVYKGYRFRHQVR
jgi:general secretion pathway protein B